MLKVAQIPLWIPIPQGAACNSDGHAHLPLFPFCNGGMQIFLGCDCVAEGQGGLKATVCQRCHVTGFLAANFQPSTG